MQILSICLNLQRMHCHLPDPGGIPLDRQMRVQFLQLNLFLSFLRICVKKYLGEDEHFQWSKAPNSFRVKGNDFAARDMALKRQLWLDLFYNK